MKKKSNLPAELKNASEEELLKLFEVEELESRLETGWNDGCGGSNSGCGSNQSCGEPK